MPTLLVARTDAHSAKLITSDVDERDQPFLTGERTAEGFFRVRDGLDAAIARALAYAPYADIVWCETSTPDLDEAREFAAGDPRASSPASCSRTTARRRSTGGRTSTTRRSPRSSRSSRELGYRFQFVTLAGFHALNSAMFELARAYAAEGMAAYVALQEREFAAEADGYTATRHQREVGAGYFDLVASAVSQGTSSTLALEGSTESAQFRH